MNNIDEVSMDIEELCKKIHKSFEKKIDKDDEYLVSLMLEKNASKPCLDSQDNAFACINDIRNKVFRESKFAIVFDNGERLNMSGVMVFVCCHSEDVEFLERIRELGQEWLSREEGSSPDECLAIKFLFETIEQVKGRPVLR
jgi:hypothetical protein